MTELAIGKMELTPNSLIVLHAAENWTSRQAGLFQEHLVAYLAEKEILPKGAKIMVLPYGMDIDIINLTKAKELFRS